MIDMKKNIVFERKFRKGAGNLAAVITIPRPISKMWAEYDRVSVEFDGERLVVTPKRSE